MRLNTKKKIRLTLATSVFAALTIWGVHLPAQDITAEETSSIDAFTQEILDEHRFICEAIREGDVEKAKGAVGKHLENAAKRAENRWR